MILKSNLILDFFTFFFKFVDMNFRGVGMPRMADNVLSFTDETFRVGSLIKCDLNTKKVKKTIFVHFLFEFNVIRNSCMWGLIFYPIMSYCTLNQNKKL